MAELTILYWRDIPAQLVARAGRRTAKAELPGRFAEAIDMAAMRAGAAGTDDYLAGWRKAAPVPCGDDLDAAVAAAAARLEAEYDRERIRRLVAAGGRETPG